MKKEKQTSFPFTIELVKQKKQPPFLLRIKLDRTIIPIILWNLFPVAGVLFAGWKPESIFVVYALETVVVGVFNIFKLIAVHFYGRLPKDGDRGISNWGLIPLFIIHYGGAVFIQLKCFFFFHDEGLFQIFSGLLKQRSYNMALGAFVINMAYSFVNGFILTGEYTKRTMGQQMFEPYPRVIVQQFVVILGGVLFGLTGNGYPVLVVFVALKIYIDLYLKEFDFNGINNRGLTNNDEA